MLQHCPQWTREIIRDHIGSAIDLVVHVTRNAAGQRRISEIVEVSQPFTGSVSVVWNSTQQQLPRRQRLAS
jgi:Flp pilus assembly CpaF family ATPase